MKYGAVALVFLICLAGVAADPASRENSEVTPVAIQAEGRGGPWLSLRDGFELPVEYAKGQRTPAGALPTALAADDFDADGMPDLVTGYAEGTAGLLVLRRGNPAAIFPHLSDRTPAPFHPSAVVVETPVAPDFLAAGDFDNDGHPDIVTASLRGTSLFLHSGDGAGGLKPARQMDLAAEVTLLTAGDVNRVDRLFELVVGTIAPDGPELRVYESPKGAWNAEPETFALPAPATAVTLGDHDRDTRADIAIVAGSELVLIRGRDRKLAEGDKRKASVPDAKVERSPLNFEAGSIAFGDFTGRGIGELALLSTDGTLALIEGATVKPIREIETGVNGGTLVRARTTTTRSDDLIIIENDAWKLHVLAGGSSTFTPGKPEMRATLSVDAQPIDVLPMRLNPDALTDLVVLKNDPDASVAVTPSAVPTIFTVINTNDSGPGSLRRAINDANFNAGADAIYFSIPGGGAHSIHALSDLPTITDPVTIDGMTQSGYDGTPLIEIHGTVVEPNRVGIDLSAGNSVVRGLAINRFSEDGISVHTAGTNIIEANYIGTDLTGGTALANGDGIDVYGSPMNRIGGRIAGQGNVISGNDLVGVRLADSGYVMTYLGSPFPIPDPGTATLSLSTSGTAIIKDLDVRLAITHPNVSDLRIFLRAPDGTQVELSTDNGGDGNDYYYTRFDDEAALSVTEGTAPFYRVYRPETPLSVLDGRSILGTWELHVADPVPSNSGTIDYWEFTFFDELAGENVIEGNRIGTDASGAVSLGDSGGVQVAANATFIGAPAAGAGNVIPNGTWAPIFLHAAGNLVQGNLIGLDASGTWAIGSGSGAIPIYGENNLVGGAALGAGNVVSVPSGCGVEIKGRSGNVIQGNHFGTDVTGTASLGGAGDGICIEGGAVNTIGGPTAETRNLISGLSTGVRITDFLFPGPGTYSSRGNAVVGNYIGTDIDGAGSLGNAVHGIAIENGHDNAIENGNVLCANGEAGVWFGPDAWANQVIDNRIGVDLGGAPDPGNGHGVAIEGRYNLIENNVISGNQGHGILATAPDTPVLDIAVGTGLPWAIPDSGSAYVTAGFLGNSRVIDVDVQIDVDHTWDSDLVIELVGPDLTLVRLTNRNGGDGDGYDGTIFDDEAAQSITEGTAPFSGSYRPEQLLAAFDGASAQGTWQLWVYDEASGDTGTIRDFSVILTTMAAQGNEIRRNTIGLDDAYLTALPNHGAGVRVEGAGNRIETNTIAGNFGPGVEIVGQSAVGNVVATNLVGFSPMASDQYIGNGGDGVLVDSNPSGAPLGNRIGLEGGGNSIYFNAGAGVRVADGTSTSIRGNNILLNGGLGIDLGPPGITHNDPLDSDSGPNGLQNFPVVTSVTVGATETVVEGFLESTPDQTFIIELYGWGPDPSGYGEGEWEATRVVTTSSTGEIPFVFSIPATIFYTSATATGPDGSTSEFSGTMTNVGASGETFDMTAWRGTGSEVEIAYEFACGATDHAIYMGASPIYGALVFSDVWCFVGTEGAAVFDPGDPGPGDFFYFVVVGQNYAHEGSYGQDSFGVERPEAAGFGECDRPQAIPAACP